MDEFFTKKTCDRCGAELTARIQSMYNEDVLCMACKQKETERPDYREAVEADHDEIRRGNLNFKGKGFADDKTHPSLIGLKKL